MLPERAAVDALFIVNEFEKSNDLVDGPTERGLEEPTRIAIGRAIERVKDVSMRNRAREGPHGALPGFDADGEQETAQKNQSATVGSADVVRGVDSSELKVIIGGDEVQRRRLSVRSRAEVLLESTHFGLIVEVLGLRYEHVGLTAFCTQRG